MGSVKREKVNVGNLGALGAVPREHLSVFSEALHSFSAKNPIARQIFIFANTKISA